VWHAYILSGRTARLLHSGSCFRNREAHYRALVGRANRWLHWKDMLQLKASEALQMGPILHPVSENRRRALVREEWPERTRGGTDAS